MPWYAIFSRPSTAFFIPKIKPKYFPFLLAYCVTCSAYAQLDKKHEAQDIRYPLVISFLFMGNHTTRENILLQEISIQSGDLATPDNLELIKQQVLDLGLFRSVRVTTSPDIANIGVNVIISVKEKWYILPVPLIGFSQDQETSYGFSLDWDNFRGLNQTLELKFKREEQAEDEKGTEEEYEFKFAYPLIAGSPWDFSFELSRKITPIDDDDEPLPSYEEQKDEVTFMLTRRFGQNFSASNGWKAGAGLRWNNTLYDANEPINEPGNTIAMQSSIDYRNIHYKVYSERGLAYGFKWQNSLPGLHWDYDYSKYEIYFRRFIDLGRRPHETLHFYADLGSYHGGPPYVDAFGLGGGGNLRGYDKNDFEGDAYYRFSIEYLVPPTLKTRSLRLIALMDAGDIFSDLDDFDPLSPKVNVGFAVRWRIKWLVDTQLDLGFAVPIEGDNIRLIARSSDLF